MLTFDGDDQLGNHGQHLGASLFEHVEYSLNSQESVWILLFSNSLKENWQVVMVIELLNLNFPVDSVLWTMLNCNRKIPSVIESPKFASGD